MNMRYFYLLTFAIVAAAIVSLTQGCAGSPMQQDFLTQASHYLATAQDIEQQLWKAYNDLCAIEESKPICLVIEQHLSELGLTKSAAAVEFANMNVDAGAKASP